LLYYMYLQIVCRAHPGCISPSVQEALASAAGSLDIILNTIPVYHDFDIFAKLLAPNGKQCLLGLHKGMAAGFVTGKLGCGTSCLLMAGARYTHSVAHCSANHPYPLYTLHAILTHPTHLKRKSIPLLAFRCGLSKVCGSVIGGIKNTQEVINLCAENNIVRQCTPSPSLVILKPRFAIRWTIDGICCTQVPELKIMPCEQLNEIYRLLDSSNDAGVRYVLDIGVPLHVTGGTGLGSSSLIIVHVSTVPACVQVTLSTQTPMRAA
jgi:uncharacterized zinc-type alcohol dehydrogenase-like protein